MLLKTARAQKEADKLRSKLASIKISTIGGENETAFEQSLAQLGWTYMSDHAPQLLDFLVGFQLVERNNDNTKAVGVFGFKVGKAWLYAPIFFINGEIKGHELLYLKDHDIFVPLDESWTNYVISQQQQPDLGFPTPGTSRELGVMQPDITPLSRPAYYGKFSSANEPQFYPNVPTRGWLSPSAGFKHVYSALTLKSAAKSAAAATDLGWSAGDSLEKLLASSPAACKLAMDICDAYPDIEHYLHEFHGPDIFERSLLKFRAELDKQAAVEQSLLKSAGILTEVIPPSVRLVTRPHAKMAEDKAVELGKRGFVIEDHRPMEKLSVAYLEKTEVMLMNPNETGLYDVLTKPGEFKKCLVLINPKGEDGRTGDAVVISAEGDSRKWMVADPARLFVKTHEYSRDDFQKWFDDLSSPDSLSEDKTYVLLTPTRGASVPFRVRAKHDNGMHEVSDSYYADCGWGQPYYLQALHPNDGPIGDSRGNVSMRLLQWQKDKGQGFNFFDGELRTPAGAKPLALADYSSNEDFLQPGNIADAELLIQSKTAGLRIWTDEYETSLNREPPQSKLACFWSLVHDHGFHEDTARELMNMATANSVSGNDLRLRVNYGEGYPLQKSAYGEGGGGLLSDTGSMSPPMPEPMYGSSAYTPGATEQYPMEQSMPIQGYGAQYTDPSVWNTSPQSMPDPMLMQMSQQAGQTGQKEFFDTNMLSSLVKNVRQGSLLQSFTPDLMKALDRLGRILFLFYWHNDEFADRYGKSDLPELEDATRNSFETLGELVLFLKERDVEPLSSQQRGEVDVESAAN